MHYVIVHLVQTQAKDMKDSALCKPTRRKKVRSLCFAVS